MKTVAAILAAGRGRRMGAGVPKQYIDIGGRPLICYALGAFQAHPEIDAVLVVTDAENVTLMKSICRKYGVDKVIAVIEGGETRRESSEIAVNYLLGEGGCLEDDIVLIHDGARPNVSARIISENVRIASECGACVTAARAVDTTFLAGPGQSVDTVLPRKNVWRAQTPQSFRLGIIKKAHDGYDKLIAEGAEPPEITDDCGLAVNIGAEIRICESDSKNLKITEPADIVFFKGVTG